MNFSSLLRARSLRALFGWLNAWHERAENRRRETPKHEHPLSHSAGSYNRIPLGVIARWTLLLAFGFIASGQSRIYAQTEIDPDHFESPDMKPFEQSVQHPRMAAPGEGHPRPMLGKVGSHSIIGRKKSPFQNAARSRATKSLRGRARSIEGDRKAGCAGCPKRMQHKREVRRRRAATVRVDRKPQMVAPREAREQRTHQFHGVE